VGVGQNVGMSSLRPTPSAAQSGAVQAPLATLEAVLERVTYANEETGYTVARVATPRASDLVTVVGALLGAQPGESLRLRGRWRSHPQYGRQFEVASFETVLPATIQGIRRYLGSGLIKGIGPRMAERIVDHFATDTLRVIEQEPGRLLEVHGLGPKRTERIGAAWEEQKAIKEVMLFLQGVGVSTSIAVRIYKTYGDEAIQTVRQTPYKLAADVWGIGFKTADTIATSLGIPHDSPERVKAGLQFALSEASDGGHCFLPAERLVQQAAGILGVDTALVQACLEDLVAEEGVVREQVHAPAAGDRGQLGEGPATVPAVYLVPFHRAEVALAGGLGRLLRASTDRLAAFQRVDWPAVLGWLDGRTGAALAPEQAAAVRLALTERVAVLTGGPGCGKSFTVRAVVALARAKGARVVLAAPTGRAAKRLAELAGMPAATLHRLLQLRPGGDAAFDRDRPLEADLVVVDEASMLDVLLANKLVKAIAPGAHLLLVGDVDQLPSVGAGEVLRDLLGSGAVPSVRLTRVFRQAAQSGVVANAHRVNAGQFPQTRGLADFFLFAQEDTDLVADLVVDVVANRIPRRFALDPRREVQVLCPMHRGAAGAGVLNERLQQVLTPARPGLPERRAGGRVYRVGDKVMQVRNNYDKGQAGVFNGSVGVITGLSVDDQELQVLLDEDEQVGYGFDELDELTHAYAVSIHRAQGSEYPCVVVPVTMSAWTMLQRNLLYTAITRAKRLVVLVGSRRALAKAVRTEGAGRCYTALAERLQRRQDAARSRDGG
jgi:exodeoxyribonuclease V alpha subunit